MRGAAELTWFKSSYSGGEGDSCVEIAITQQAIHVRDSKDLTRPAFTVACEGWSRFMRSVAAA